MYSDNPLVQESTAKTLNQLINTLNFMVDTMPLLGEAYQRISDDDDGREESQVSLPRTQYDGLVRFIDCVRAATVSCVEQHNVELQQQARLIRQLQAKVDQAQ